MVFGVGLVEAVLGLGAVLYHMFLGGNASFSRWKMSPKNRASYQESIVMIEDSIAYAFL